MLRMDATERTERAAAEPQDTAPAPVRAVEDEISRARRVADAQRLNEERRLALREEMVRSMIALHEADVSWAEIGRIFGCTPQAAMYATGYAKRTPRSKS